MAISNPGRLVQVERASSQQGYRWVRSMTVMVSGQDHSSSNQRSGPLKANS